MYCDYRFCKVYIVAFSWKAKFAKKQAEIQNFKNYNNVTAYKVYEKLQTRPDTPLQMLNGK